MKKETKKKISSLMLSVVASATVTLGMSGFSTIQATSIEPTVTIDKTAQWVNIEEGIGKITLTEEETVGENVDIADYLIIYDVSGSMPIVTVNGYEPGTYNVEAGDVVNIGCKNPNHYSVLKPGYLDNVEGWRNALHYDNNGTPDDTSDDILLNYTSSVYQKMNWKGDVIQTFYLSSPKDFMYSRANGCYCTLDTSQEMLNKFIDNVEKYNPNAQFAYVAFGGKVAKYNGFTSGDVVKELINTSTQYSGTFYGPALSKADEILDTYTGDKPVKVIFLTDGDNYDETDALDYLAILRQHHPDVEIYAVSADYEAVDGDDIKVMGDKYIYLSSDNVEETVNNFIDYSLSKTLIRAAEKSYTDIVSDYFEIINTPQYPLSANTSFSGNNFKWYVPLNDTGESKTYQTSFYIKLKDEYRKTPTDRLYETNMDSDTSYGAVLEYTIYGGENDGESRTLSHETPKLPYGLQTIDVTKVWNDENNEFNTRPSSITLNLNKNGSVVDTKTISSNTTTFNGYTETNGMLEVYSLLYDNNSQRVQNTYTVTENSVENYDTVQTGSSDNGYVVENKLNMPSELEIRYVDTQGNTLLETKNYSGKVGQGYETTGPDIYGYKLTAIPSNAEGKYQVDKTIVTYVYENIITNIKVNHIDKYTDNVLYTTTDTGLIGDKKTTTSMDIENYVLVESPETETYILTKDTIVVNYYYAKVNNLVVKYLDEVTGEELSTTLTSKVTQGEPYETEQKSFENYTFTKDTLNTKGTVGSKDIEVIYYYRKNTTGINVRYIDQVTKEEISESYHIDGLEAEEYDTEERKIEGYELVLVPTNANGKLEVNNDDVVYEYRKVAKLTVKHIDANTGEEIADDVVKTYKEGEEYEGYPVNIEGYTLVETPEETEGIMGREDVEMTFKYKKISAGLVVKYVDEITGEVLDEDTFEGNEKDVIDLIEKSFDGYELVSRPEEESVELKVEPQEEIFYYKKQLDIKIKGIDQDTGEVLYTDSQEGLQGEKYETESREIKDYDLVVIPDNAKGEFEPDNEEIVYEYRRIAGDVIVKYLDNYTYEELDSDSFSGHVGDTYKTDMKDFDNYIFVSITGEPQGKLDKDTHEVIYYYEKKKGNVVIIYEDKEGNVLLQDELEGRIDDSFAVTEEKIPGYTVVQRPDELEGKYIDGTIELKFILDKGKGQIIVNFVDTDGNHIHTTIYDEDYIGEDFYLDAPDIDGYDIISDRIVKREFIDGEIVVNITYQNIPEENVEPDTPNEEVKEEEQPNETEKTEITEIAENPKTADVNVVIYLIALLAWTVTLVKKLRKN